MDKIKRKSKKESKKEKIKEAEDNIKYYKYLLYKETSNCIGLIQFWEKELDKLGNKDVYGFRGKKLM